MSQSSILRNFLLRDEQLSSSMLEGAEAAVLKNPFQETEFFTKYDAKKILDFLDLKGPRLADLFTTLQAFKKRDPRDRETCDVAEAVAEFLAQILNAMPLQSRTLNLHRLVATYIAMLPTPRPRTSLRGAAQKILLCKGLLHQLVNDAVGHSTVTR